MSSSSYAVPEALAPELLRLQAYWKDLERGEADMPFADDIDPTRLPDLAGALMLLTVFENPTRFRFESAGAAVSDRYGASLAGEFSDELKDQPPLEEFTAQALATVDTRKPTFFRSSGGGYSRLLLPAWGDGHIAMLVGAVSQEAGDP
jgi:hypothetical protein